MKLFVILSLLSVALLGGCSSKNGTVNVKEQPIGSSSTSSSNSSSNSSSSSSSNSSSSSSSGWSSSSSSSSTGSVSGPPAKNDTSNGVTFLNEGPEEEAPIAVPESFFYFSYDDSSSTASHDLTVFYIQNGLRPYDFWGRTYEYLNAESFEHFSAESVGPFEVSMGVYAAKSNEFPLKKNIDLPLYSLGVNVSGPTLTKEDRPNIVATILLDISGSMETQYATETRSDIRSLLDVAKHALKTMTQSLKVGDVVNIVTFSTQSKALLLDWQYSLEPEVEAEFIELVDSIVALGSTNLNEGIEQAYKAAQASFDSEKSNRVIIMTDAFANSGEVDPSIIAQSTVINELEGIYFAGVGIGSTFNDDFLNQLTDIGKGYYSAMVTPEDSERIFGRGFANFIDAAVRDIRFKISYPSSYIHLVEESSAEEISTDKKEVKATNFAYNNQQFFLEHFTASEAGVEDTMTLEVSFKNSAGEEVVHSLEKPVEELLLLGEDQIKSAEMVAALSGVVDNSLTCFDVQNSPFFSWNTETYIFEKHRNLINDLCGL